MDFIAATGAGAEKAAQLLIVPTGMAQLTLEDARVVVNYMVPRFFAADTTFIKEGDAGDGGFMYLILEGEVVVESITVSRTEPLTIQVLGPGSLIGEVGLVDKSPRSASCTASTPLYCAILSRPALENLLKENPHVGAKLLMAISTLLAHRLRDTLRKLRLYAQLAMAMHEEIDSLTREE
jgi:CRP-like cAMP-binding protein